MQGFSTPVSQSIPQIRLGNESSDVPHQRVRERCRGHEPTPPSRPRSRRKRPTVRRTSRSVRIPRGYRAVVHRASILEAAILPPAPR